MFEMITGEVPFEGKNALAIAIKHMNEELPEIEDINPDADGRLQDIIYKATEKRCYGENCNNRWRCFRSFLCN